MCPQTEVFTSSRGYRLGINNTNSHQRNGWIEIPMGKPPIRIYFNSICAQLSSHHFNFCSFITWGPYFDEFSSAISGLYFEDKIHLKWVTMANTGAEECAVVNSGTDKLVRSSEQFSNLTDGQVPHPFNMEMLRISTDRIKIETAPGQEWLRNV